MQVLNGAATLQNPDIFLLILLLQDLPSESSMLPLMALNRVHENLPHALAFEMCCLENTVASNLSFTLEKKENPEQISAPRNPSALLYSLFLGLWDNYNELKSLNI